MSEIHRNIKKEPENFPVLLRLFGFVIHTGVLSGKMKEKNVIRIRVGALAGKRIAICKGRYCPLLKALLPVDEID